MNGNKTGRNSYYKMFSFALLASLSLILLTAPSAFAQAAGSNFTVVAGDEIKKNPTAVKILKNIEIAKQRLAEMQTAQKQITEHEKFIEEQRQLAKERLERDLAAFNKDHEDFMPKNAFAKFVSRVNATHSAFYWDQFDYLNNKITIATQAKQAILQSGGSYAEAQAEFIKYASMSRTEMIKLVSDLNIKHGFTDDNMQSYFDENGKLPRYEDDQKTICYACDKYEKIKEEMLLAEKRSKST